MKVFLLFLLFYSNCYGFEVDYSLFSTSEELLFYEKTRLEECGLKNEELGEAYIDLGESYLFAEKYELALEHLAIGYTLLMLISTA
jgi:hypothetical protein